MISTVAGDATNASMRLETTAFTAQLESALEAAHRLATVIPRDRPAAEAAVQERRSRHGKAWPAEGWGGELQGLVPFHRDKRVPDGAPDALVARDPNGLAEPLPDELRSVFDGLSDPAHPALSARIREMIANPPPSSPAPRVAVAFALVITVLTVAGLVFVGRHARPP